MRWRSTVLSLLTLSILAACGGGGGGNSEPSPPSTVPPTISSQPSSVSIPVGQTATFSVAASGSAPLTYQWRRNGASIAGATASSYTTPPAATGDNGAVFSVLVSNSAGSVTSNPATLTVSSSPSSGEAALKQIAGAFPTMPTDTVSLAALIGRVPTFASGLPLNDLEYTIFDTDYMDGETNGYDVFLPVDPSQPTPGANRIKLVVATGNVQLDTTYGGQRGDRIILGTAEISSPFFLRGGDGIDNDYVVITSFDYSFGHIQLRGSIADYALVRCTLADGCRTDGYYLFYTASSQPDLMAFIFRCDDLPTSAVGGRPQTSTALCNASKTLSLSDPNQFRFATPVSTTVAVPGQRQIGTSGREVVGGVATDGAGNQYIVGQTDGSFNGGGPADNRIFAARINANGTLAWVHEIAQPDGALLFDATTDGEYLYAVGRTHGALPGFANAGRWDGIILKLRLSDGSLVASNQWGNSGLDGYGNVVLDDAGNLYVSGQGSPAGVTGTDDSYVFAKHRSSDLGTVWRVIVAPQTTGPGATLVSEAWGGLSYIPGISPGKGRLVTGGWLMRGTPTSINANGFMELWSDLDQAEPRRLASATIASAGDKADWVLDNAVDSAGNIYAVGYTTGDLQGTHRGDGDAFIVRFDANLQNPVFRQIGTPQSDSFRRMRIDNAGDIHAVGYTYGNWTGSRNADTSLRSGDVIIQKFDSNLNPVAALQFGTPHEDRAVVTLRAGVLHVGGMTEAALGGASAGSFDAFVVKVNPSTLQVQP